MTAVDEFLTQQDKPARPEPERDRWGRYVIPDPDTGKKRSWTRATTHAKTCADTFGLTKWQNRMVTLGLARRPDLLAQAATVADPDDPAAKKLLGRVADEAQEFAGRSVRANLGVALHSFTEQIDAGQKVTAPPQFAADLDAYRAATALLVMDPGHIERIVTVPELGVAGTFDRLATVDGQLVVADLKTGRDLSYSWGEIAIQLALYAHAQTIYDPASGRHTPMPGVNLERALVIHLPVGEANCTLHWVDIAAGWEMAHVCETVRAWRKRRDLATNYEPSKPPTVETATPGADRAGWLRGRMRTLAGIGGARLWVAAHWPQDTPTRPPWTDTEQDAVAAVLSLAEQRFTAPFPETSDPSIPVKPAPVTGPPDIPDLPTPTVSDGDDDVTVTNGVADGLRRQVVDLDKPHRAVCQVWGRDATTAGRSFDMGANGLTYRRYLIATAAAACAANLYDADEPDELTRAALAEVLDQPLHPTWHTGAVLGSLDSAQAGLLATIAHTFPTDTSVAERLGARIAAQTGPETSTTQQETTK